MLKHVCDDISATADKLGIDIIGGHTEVTDAVNRIVISSTAIGRTPSDRLVSSSGACPGDKIVMTKYAALEGTYIISNDHKDKLNDVLTFDEFEEACKAGDFISALNDGMIGAANGATAMHDVTEGGVFGAVYEMCDASGCGCCLYRDDIPVLDVTKKICNALKLDYCRLIGSGSMLITAPDADRIISALAHSGIKAAVIGCITAKDRAVISGGKTMTLSPPAKDEIFSL